MEPDGRENSEEKKKVIAARAKEGLSLRLRVGWKETALYRDTHACAHRCIRLSVSLPPLPSQPAFIFTVRIRMNGPTTESEYHRRQCGANVETSDDRMQIASLTRRMQVHNTDVYTPLGVGVYTCVNVSMTGAGFILSFSSLWSFVVFVVVRRRLVRSPPLPSSPSPSPHAIRIHIRLHLDPQGLWGLETRGRKLSLSFLIYIYIPGVQSWWEFYEGILFPILLPWLIGISWSS